MSNKLHSEKRIKSVANIASSTDGDPVLFEDGDVVYDLTSQSFKKKSGALGGGSWGAAISSTSGPLNDISDVDVTGLSASDIGDQLTYSYTDPTKTITWRSGTTIEIAMVKAGKRGYDGNVVAITFVSDAGTPAGAASYSTSGNGTLQITYSNNVTTATQIKTAIDGVSDFTSTITGTASDTANAADNGLSNTTFAGGFTGWKAGPSGTGNAQTNLTYDAGTRTIASSTGIDVALPNAVAGGNSGLMTGADKTKLDDIETNADVTDAANVTAAGALMDSELAGIAHVKSLDQSVDSGTSPTFGTANMTDATDKRFVTDAQVGYLVPMGSGNSYAQGLVLAGNGTHNNQFLRKDGTWQAISTNFTGLTDTPSAYAGSSADANKFLKVNGSGSGIVFTAVSIPGAVGDLSDVPAPGGGDGNKFVKVNSGGNALEYVNVSIPANISDLGDVDAIGSNANRGKFLKVKSGADAVEYATASIGDLSDVDLTGNADTKILAFNNSNSRFEAVNQVTPGIANVLADGSPRLGGDLECDDGSGTDTNTTNTVRSIKHVKEISFRGLNSTTNTSGVKFKLTNNARALLIDMAYGKAERDHDNNAVVIGAKGGNSATTDEDLANNVSQLMSDTGKSLFLRSSFTGAGSAIQINHSANNLAANATGDREGIEFRLASDSTNISSVSLKPYKLNTTSNVDNGKVPDLRFYNQYGNYIALKAPLATTSSASYTFTLPVDDGSANQLLKTDGNGALSWSNEIDVTADGVSILADVPIFQYLMINPDGTQASTVTTSGSPTLTTDSGNTIGFATTQPTAPTQAIGWSDKYFEFNHTNDVVKIDVSSAISTETTKEFYFQFRSTNFDSTTHDEFIFGWENSGGATITLAAALYKQNGSSWESIHTASSHTQLAYDTLNELTNNTVHWLKVTLNDASGNVADVAKISLSHHAGTDIMQIANFFVDGNDFGNAVETEFHKDGYIGIKEQLDADPTAPSAGQGGRLYAKNDGKLHFRSSTGTYDLTAGSGTPRSVGVDTDGNGSTDFNLSSGETLVLKAGSNMSLTESGGVVTFNAAALQPGHILAYDVDGHNTTNQEYAVTTSFAVFNTSHVCTFNAPASGNVLVEAQVFVECQAAAAALDVLELSLSTGTSYSAFVPGAGFTGVEKKVAINSHVSVDEPRQIINCSWVLKTIGSGSKTIYLAAKSNNASGFKILYGNEYPDLIMKVTQL